MPHTPDQADASLCAHREQFMAALPSRLEALERGFEGLRARPQSQTARTALQRRLSALADAATLLDLDQVVAALSDALIALEADELGDDDFALLEDGLAALRPRRTLLSPVAPPPESAVHFHPPTTPAVPVTEQRTEPAMELEPLSDPAPDSDAGVSLDALVAELGDELRAALLSKHGSHNVQLDESAKEAARAVTWSAISQLRELISEAASGNVEYDGKGPEGALLVAPSRRASQRPPADVSILRGARVLVADDDPAVLWFLGSALRAVGATVTEASNGLAAWNLALENAPDLLISDVMMPELDGFGLCRNFKRDVVLSDVPVVLLSWKEDLLQRVRELGADADGYIAKGSESQVVLERCAEAMATRQKLETRFLDDDIVHGRLDGVTPFYVLSLAAKSGADKTVEFCDAGFAYEAHFDGGELVSVLRRGGEGVHRGEDVLAGLLGMRAGRFIVRAGLPDDMVRLERRGSLGTILAPHVRRIRDACRCVRGAEMHGLRRLKLDQRVTAPYASSSPTVARKLIERLGEGTAPSALQRSVTGALLETVLGDLALRGAIVSAIDSNGKDLLRDPSEVTQAPVDADLKTPAPQTAMQSDEHVSKARVESSGRETERGVVFTDSLRASGDRHDQLLQAASEESQAAAEKHQTRANASVQTSQREGTTKTRDAVEPSRRPEPAETSKKSHPPAASSAPTRRADSGFTALNARIDELFSKEGPGVDLSQAILAGLSLTPGSSDVVPRGELAARIKRRTAHRRIETSRAESGPEKSSHRTDEPDLSSTNGSAHKDSPTTQRSSRVTLVKTLSVVTKTWDSARQHASVLAQRSRSWFPEHVGLDDSSMPLAVAERVKPESPVTSAPRASGTDSEVARESVVKQEAAATRPPDKATEGDSFDAQGAKESLPHIALDDDATDPDSVPPVDSKPSREFVIPLPRSLPDLGLAKKVFVPIAMVSIGGYAAFSLVGALSSAVPLGPQAQPVLAEASPAESSQTSAATELLQATKSVGEDEAGDIAEGAAVNRTLNSQVLPLPDGIVPAPGKGLLEVNTGDKHKIYVDGVFVGRGPARRMPLGAGKHEVKTRLGADEHTYVVEVQAEKRTRLEPVDKTAAK